LHEIELVNGAGTIDIHLVVEKAFDFGAMGVLIKAVSVANPTLPIIGNAFAIGAGVGACYAIIKSALSI